MAEEPFILLDRASRNILGEFDALEDAQAERREYIEAAPDAAASLEIWHGDVQVPIDPESLTTAPAA
jgi:hypothetical protein